MKYTRILSSLLCLLLTACVSEPDGYLKKSGRGRIISNSNIYSKKRSPVYNAKYIKKAKQNIMNHNFDSEQEYNEYDSQHINLEMYKKLLMQERKNKRNSYENAKTLQKLEQYEQIQKEEAKMKEISEEYKKNQENLKAEIKALKAIIDDAKDKITNIKCISSNEQQTNQKKIKKLDTHNKGEFDIGHKSSDKITDSKIKKTSNTNSIKIKNDITDSKVNTSSDTNSIKIKNDITDSKVNKSSDTNSKQNAQVSTKEIINKNQGLKILQHTQVQQ